MKFKAYWVEETSPAIFVRSIADRDTGDLDKHPVLIRVLYSALNYKDALSASGHKGITRTFPHTPGIDAAGIVERSSDPRWKAGDEVVVTGYDLGMDTDGGFGQFISVPAEWIVPKPNSLTLKQCAALGTAAFTAALALHKMELNGQTPDKGPVLVTGATGAVGSMAVRWLSLKGYEVFASTGKSASYEYLKNLGANLCLPRFDKEESPEKPLLRSQWAAAIDTVGGVTLSNAIRACKAGGNIAVCGLVQSPFFTLNVYPFIIKDINVLGVASAETDMTLRLKIWNSLQDSPPLHDFMFIDSDLESLDGFVQKMLVGGLQGRVVLDLWK